MLILSTSSSALLFFFFALVHRAQGLAYSDLIAMGMDCLRYDSCRSRNNLTYSLRNCECDSECNIYNDCCIDAPNRASTSQPSSENRMICIPYRKDIPQAGVYAIANCSDDWNGSSEVRQKCEGPDDLSNLFNVAPVTNTEMNVTYRNRYCAECNNKTSPLTLFHAGIVCKGLGDLAEDDIVENIVFNSTLDTWGVHRLNEFSNETTLVGCDIIFDVPDYLENSVRLCRSNVISTCSSNWTQNSVKSACQKYMAIVFEGSVAYRNPHCAICNHRDIYDLSCPSVLISQSEVINHPHIFDINRENTDQVGRNFSSNEILDTS